VIIMRGLAKLTVAFLLAAAGCAATRDQVAAEMACARVAYFRADAGPATVLIPGELRDARATLDAAEAAFRARPDDPRTADLAYISSRRSALVESHAGLILARRRKAEAVRELDAARAAAEAAR
jgi:hypothetical protein